MDLEENSMLLGIEKRAECSSGWETEKVKWGIHVS